MPRRLLGSQEALSGDTIGKSLSVSHLTGTSELPGSEARDRNPRSRVRRYGAAHLVT